MRLSDLTGANSDQSLIEIRGLSADSRHIEPGYLFAALSGAKDDGLHYVSDAISQGAVAILAPPGAPVHDDVYVLTDPNPRRRFALMAARFYGRQPEVLAAVTGTNGKSSVASFTRQIWEKLGHSAASIGTLGITGPHLSIDGSLTTPDPVTLFSMLRRLDEDGTDHAVIEASSHGLSQYRLDGLRLRAAGFTNLTRDHLDYHGGEEAYYAAKKRLFSELLDADGAAVLNADSGVFEDLDSVCRERGLTVLSYGVKGGDLRLAGREILPGGQRLRLQWHGKAVNVTVPLIGDFQSENVQCAACLAIACGAEPEAVFDALPLLEGVRGRMELVTRHPNGAPVYVDYAHTPDALERVLKTLREHTKGNLHVVFGCGGERDSGKRPMMGAIAARLADCVYVTDDNPRGEDAAAIRRAILESCPGAVEAADRGAAVTQAISDLAPDDVLLLAGKGHEQGQIIGEKSEPFDDAEQARQAVLRIKDREKEE